MNEKNDDTLYSGTNGLSMDRCGYDSAAWRGLDSWLGMAFGRLFLDAWQSVDIVGRRYESFWGVIAKCWLVDERWYVDVDIVVFILAAIGPFHLSGSLWTLSRSKWRLHSEIFAHIEGKPQVPNFYPKKRVHDIFLVLKLLKLKFL